MISIPLLVFAGAAAAFFYREIKKHRTNPDNADPLLSLRGSGKRLWAQEHADDCVRRLREG
ncbi:MAG: hypothetical protein WA463_10360 [Terriglobales bacterium]